MRTLWRNTLLASVVLATLAGLARGETTLLKYDDNSADAKRSMTGAAQAVRFECPDEGKWYIDSIRVHGSRYGTPQAPNEDFQIFIASDDLQQRVEIKRPYSLFERGNEKWVRIKFDPVEVQGAFHVAMFFNPTRTKGVYVSIDEDSDPTHSSILASSEPGKKQSDLKGDWMIRAYLSDKAEGEVQTLLSDTQRTERRLDDEAAGDAKLLGDARSLTLRQDEGATDDHMNIQGGIYTLEFETPKQVEAYVWQVQVYASQFGGEHDSEAVSGDIYVLDANRHILSRTTFPYSVATQQKAWISIPTLPTKVQGKFYISIDTHGNMHKGLYVGYRDDKDQQLASTDVRTGDTIAPAEWSTKFSSMQWLLRVKVADRPVTH